MKINEIAKQCDVVHELVLNIKENRKNLFNIYFPDLT